LAAADWCRWAASRPGGRAASRGSEAARSGDALPGWGAALGDSVPGWRGLISWAYRFSWACLISWARWFSWAVRWAASVPASGDNRIGAGLALRGMASAAVCRLRGAADCSGTTALDSCRCPGPPARHGDRPGVLCIACAWPAVGLWDPARP